MWSRARATQALSIFGDHSDVMATRATGFALLASNSVQEAQDLALIAHASTLEARVPFLHFFDGFRTSHEIDKIEQVSREDMRAMIDDRFVQAHRQRALSQQFTPAMVKGIFDEMCKAEPKRRFTVGIHDDVTSTSLDYDPALHAEGKNLLILDSKAPSIPLEQYAYYEGAE